MGIDTRILLPTNVRIHDVATVIAKLVGIPVTKEILDKHSYHAKIAPETDNRGLKVVTSSVPSMLMIQWWGGSEVRPQGNMFYHYESGYDYFMGVLHGDDGAIAIGKGLVDFFGGIVDFNDCDNEDHDYSMPTKSRKMNAPEDGPEWHNFQDRILALEPLKVESPA